MAVASREYEFDWCRPICDKVMAGLYKRWRAATVAAAQPKT